jgi:hypothetical protein
MYLSPDFTLADHILTFKKQPFLELLFRKFNVGKRTAKISVPFTNQSVQQRSTLTFTVNELQAYST